MNHPHFLGMRFGELYTTGFKNGKYQCVCSCGRKCNKTTDQLHKSPVCSVYRHRRLGKTPTPGQPGYIPKEQPSYKRTYFLIRKGSDQIEGVFDTEQQVANYLGVTVCAISAMIRRKSKRIEVMENEPE